jgi:transposase
VFYCGRNAIEKMFYRLNDFRRVATLYGKLAADFLTAVQFTAIVSYCYESRP